jgi:tetratricopeptide (TPR) repeat protein
MHYIIGCVFRSGGQYLKAEQEFLKALAIAPDDADVHYNLGILYEENLKNPKKARKHYERYIELAPSEKDAARVSQWLAEMGV